MPSAVLPARPIVPPREVAWIGGNMPVARFGLILNLFLPLLILIWDAFRGGLGADPVKYAIHTTGLCAVTFLVASLAITPLRLATGWTWIVQFRRALGVFAFYYACAHLTIYFWWDRSHNLQSTVHEIIHRYYLLIGFSSLTLMAPLWATSFNAAIQAMGPVWWKRLHRLAYIAAGLACYHFYLQTKADKRRPDVYIAILAGLFLWRVVVIIRHRRASAKTTTVEASASDAPVRFWKGSLKVVAMRRETAAVRTFRLAPVSGGAIPFAFQAGQFLNLSLKIEGKSVSRSYTIASPPSRKDHIELTIKRESNGFVSSFLHEMLESGQEVAVTAPAGRFTFDPASSESVLLVAGGVGITPVMSILRDLTDHSWPGRIDLVFSVHSAADVIFADELRDLTDRHPNLHVHVTLSRDPSTDWVGLRGRIDGRMLQQCVPDVINRPAYICGPDTMAQAVRARLISLGTPEDRIHLESFTPASAVAVEDSVSSLKKVDDAGKAIVTFKLSGISTAFGTHQTILEAAESVGVAIDYQCRSGICGTCRCKLLTGQVTMPIRDALSNADEAEGYILACQAHPVGDVTVDV